MPGEETAAKKEYTGGAVGAGLVLVVLPCIGLYFGIDRIGGLPVVGLPILAIFGIMVLFGALALVSTLFARLGLSDPAQALALPEGSIRAAIALALIVLFAIISIMLYQSMSKPYVIPDLSEAEKVLLVKDPANRIIAVEPVCQTKDCASEVPRYSVHVLQPQEQAATDLAKQLLILIGTLMTSVTSFYFASRTAEPKRQESFTVGDPARSFPGSPQSEPSTLADESNVDGCDVPIADATPDEDLPASKGGIA